MSSLEVPGSVCAFAPSVKSGLERDPSWRLLYRDHATLRFRAGSFMSLSSRCIRSGCIRWLNGIESLGDREGRGMTIRVGFAVADETKPSLSGINRLPAAVSLLRGGWRCPLLVD